MYCFKCGSELKGAKTFCSVCGVRQTEIGRSKLRQKPQKEEKKKVEEEETVEAGECYRCGELSERKCFFCEKHICKEHITRLQANVASYIDMQHYVKHNDKLRINQGWRGYIIYACPRCSSIRQSKDLTEEETEKIQTIDVCAWYPVDIYLK
jgi:phage FluMu protein Com